MATKKRKYQDGGAPASFKDQKKAIKQSNKLAALTAKGERIKAGTEPTLYDKAAKITGNIADTAASASTIVKAVKDKSGGSGDASGRPGFQKGGAMSTVKAGVKQVAKGVKKGVTDSVKSAKTVAKAAIKATPEYRAYKAAGKTAKSIDDTIQKRYPNYTGKGSMYAGAKKGIKTLLGYKTGGMVNPNAAVKRQSVAGSKGVKSGVNPRAAASKVARGRSGGTSAAPKTALPKAQKGWSVDDPYKRGVMGSGASATKTSDRKVGGLGVIHGGTRTKTINAGGIYPGAKGSITKSKTDNKGKVTGSRTREISQERANKMIDRKRN